MDQQQKQLTKRVIEKVRKMIHLKVQMPQIMQYIHSLNLDDNDMLNALYLIDITLKKEELKSLNNAQNEALVEKKQESDVQVANSQNGVPIAQHQHNNVRATYYEKIKASLKTSSLRPKRAVYEHLKDKCQETSQNTLLNNIQHHNQDITSYNTQTSQINQQHSKHKNITLNSEISAPSHTQTNNNTIVEKYDVNILNPNETIIEQMQRQYVNSLLETRSSIDNLSRLNNQLFDELQDLKSQYQVKKDKYIKIYKNMAQQQQQSYSQSHMIYSSIFNQSQSSSIFYQTLTSQLELENINYHFGFIKGIDIDNFPDVQMQKQLQQHVLKQTQQQKQQGNITIDDLVVGKSKQNINQTTGQNSKAKAKQTKQSVQDQNNKNQSLNNKQNEQENTSTDESSEENNNNRKPLSRMHHNEDNSEHNKSDTENEYNNNNKRRSSIYARSNVKNLKGPNVKSDNQTQLFKRGSKVFRKKYHQQYETFIKYIEQQFAGMEVPAYDDFYDKHLNFLANEKLLFKEQSLNPTKNQRNQKQNNSKQDETYAQSINNTTKKTMISDFKTHILFCLWCKQSLRSPDVTYSIYQLISYLLFKTDLQIKQYLQLGQKRSIKQLCNVLVDYCSDKYMVNDVSNINKHFDYAELILILNKQFQLRFIQSKQWVQIFQNATKQILQIHCFNSMAVVFDMTEILHKDPEYNNLQKNTIDNNGKQLQKQFNRKTVHLQSQKIYNEGENLINAENKENKQLAQREEQHLKQQNITQNQQHQQENDIIESGEKQQQNTIKTSKTHDKSNQKMQQFADHVTSDEKNSAYFSNSIQYDLEGSSTTHSNENLEVNQLVLSKILPDTPISEQMFDKLETSQIYGVVIIGEQASLAEIQKYKLCYLNFINDSTNPKIKMMLTHPQYLITLTICSVSILNLQNCVNLQNFYTENNQYSQENIQTLQRLRRFYSVRDTYKGYYSMLRQLMKTNVLEYINVLNGNNITDAGTYQYNIKALRFFNVYGRRSNLNFVLDISVEYPENLKILRYYLPQHDQYIKPYISGSDENVKRLNEQLIN